MKRGIIAAPGVVRKLSNGFEIERSITLDEMRYYALYWDKVAIPSNNLFNLGVPQEEGFILSGAIERPKIDFYGSHNAIDAAISCHILVAENLVKDKKVDWVIQQFGDALIVSDEYSEERNTLRIDLASCLPVPTGEVNIQDILNFKEQRRDEFEALHEYIDEVYQQTLLFPDQALASKTAVSKLAKSIDELDRITLERFRLFKKHNLSTVFNIYREKITDGVIMDLTLAAMNGASILPASTIGGIISATLTVSAGSARTFKPADKNLKLAYLSKAHKDGLYRKL